MWSESDALQVLSFAHGFLVANDYGLGIVDNVRQALTSRLHIPLMWRCYEPFKGKANRHPK